MAPSHLVRLPVREMGGLAAARLFVALSGDKAVDGAQDDGSVAIRPMLIARRSDVARGG